MKQIESFAIENPCQHICRFNRQRYCRTCMRHMNERIEWDEYSDEEKREVLRKCYRRKLAYRRVAYAQMQQAKYQNDPRPEEQLSLFNLNELAKAPPKQTVPPAGDDDDPQMPLF